MSAKPTAETAGAGNGATGSSAEEQLRSLYDQAESGSAKALEELASKQSFGRLLALSTENIAAMARIGHDLADLVLRNMRIAGRADITRLARQLHRNEDKLERVLQELERLRDELAAERRDRAEHETVDGIRKTRDDSR